MRKLLLALLVVAVMAMPAFASVQNIKVSGSVDSAALYRENFELGLNSSAGADEVQNLFLTITKIGIDADLTDNVSATVELINERAWGTDGANNGEVDVNLAYVTLREMLYSPLTVVIGRQNIRWGNGLIIGANYSTDSALSGVASDVSEQSGFDAVKIVLDYNPLTIEGFFSRITDGTSGLTNLTNDVNLFGIKAAYELGDDMDSMVEVYVVKQLDTNNASGNTNLNGYKADQVLVKGIRGSSNPIEGLNLQAELAFQQGNATSDTATVADKNTTRKAKAVQLMSTYKIPALEDYNPVAAYTFTYFSGDKVSSTDNTAWASGYEDQNVGKIYDTLFDESNLIIHQLALSANPMEDVLTTLTYAKLYTANGDASTISLLQPDSVAVTRNVANGSETIGQEIDLDVVYNYTEDVQILGTLGFFKPGEFFGAYDDRTPAKQAMVRVNVGF